MSNQRPYSEYEPNEPPHMETGARKTLSPARPISSGTDSYTHSATGTDGGSQRASQSGYGWDASQYTPNEAPETTARHDAGTVRHRTARAANPYTQATWDEEPYIHQGSEPQSDYPVVTGEPMQTPAQSAKGTAYAPASRDLYAKPVSQPETAHTAQRPSVNPYARPATAVDGVSDLSAKFAPPLKFELPAAPRPMAYTTVPEPEPSQPNLYRTKGVSHSAAENPSGPAARSDGYRVEADDGYGRATRRRRHPIRKLLVTLLILGILGAVGYVERDWLITEARKLLGQSTIPATLQDVASDQQPEKGYDPAPTLQVGKQAQEGMQAVAGELGLETYAVTESNVIARVKTGENLYDIYLFAASDGLLLGYYEGVTENGFLVCPDDIYYVNQPPYLITSRGEPLVDAKRIRGAAGEGAVLGPMINGWATLTNAQGTSGNLMDADGNLFSQLWFCRVFPFTADRTLAYVDTGNTTDPEERYTLYELTRDGTMQLWKHSADTSEVLACAAGVALMNTGDLIRLGGDHTPLCTANDVAIYADCGAAIVRDIQTGKYGLFVNGEQRYDFAYDSIAPVASDIQWSTEVNGLYQLHTVTGRAYPLPLAYYFTLKKGDTQEMVALSAGSAYPLLLQNN